ncbi:hypothetical protein LBMAG51_05410 [Phycisphaerae bacterium]|nr:hypothetical protein LBMAG51_05410 [Phycisphaerae bacterium]
MAFFGIGKKTPKAGNAPADIVAPDDGAMEFGDAAPVAVTPVKKGRFGLGGGKSGGKVAGAQKAAKTKASAANPKSKGAGGELNIYTGILAAAVVALAAGCLFVAMDNLSGVEGTNDEGNPFAVISSR